MRNESESTSTTRPEAMDGGVICAILEDLTIQTEVRIWYWTKEKFKSEQFDENEYEDEDDEVFVPYRDSEEMAEAELSAIELDTCLYATVTSVEEFVEMDALGGMGGISFAYDVEDGIHHIEVVKVGLPPAEEVDFGHYDDLRADPAEDHVTIANQDISVENVRKLHAALGRWLEHKGVEA